MGKARQAPEPSYQRMFVITHHAIQRFRERVEKDTQSRSDADIGNLLDERIRQATDRQSITDLANVETPTTIYAIESRDGIRYWAVVRDMTCVTVLDQHMLDLNFLQGKWKRGPFNTPFAAIAKTLRGRAVEEPAERKLLAAPPELAVVEPPVDIGALGAQMAQAMLEVARIDARLAALAERRAELDSEIRSVENLRDGQKLVVEDAQARLMDAVKTVARSSP